MIHEDPSEQRSWSESRDTQQPRVDWRRAHEDLSRLARCRARLDWEEGRSLLDALRSGAHLHLGFGSFGEYVERLLGYKRRSTDERLRVAEALENLPELGQALREGSMTWSVVRELSRVATPENEHAWLDVARGRTVRQIEELVAGHRPGDRPEDAYDSSLRRHVLRFEVSADTFATFREAMAKLRRDTGSRLDDDAALLLLARQTLGGPTEPGRANYQLALTVCEECGRGWQQGRGEMVEVGSEVVEMASCDAQHLGPIDRQPGPPDHSNPCEDAGTSDAHACLERKTVRVVTAGERKSVAHVSARASRARQDVPPAIRRLVMRRDGGRCVVPGCFQGVFVDIHHVVPRSEGGDHDPDGLAVLCCAHHRALHRGQLIIEGRISNGLVFRHADGTSYGHVVHPRAAAIHEETFRALRSLGFRESESRRALESVRASAHVGDPSIQGILRQALARLASNRKPQGLVVDVR
jgi:RuvA, C-terminal domain/HNH endonuclease